jgi:aspartate aminotransferase-like enzyme
MAKPGLEGLEDEHSIYVGTGRGPWKDSVLRVGHMGYVNRQDIVDVADALASVLEAHARD